MQPARYPSQKGSGAAFIQRVELPGYSEMESAIFSGSF